MANGLLGAIANPQIANIVGAVQQGQQLGMQRQLFEQQQAQLAQQAQVRQLAGQILGNTLGGKLAGGGFQQLAQTAPQEALKIAQGLGVPLDQPGRIDNLVGTALMAETIAKSVGPEAALGFVQNERTKLHAFGINTPIMDQFVTQLQQDPVSAMTGLSDFVTASRDAGLLKGKGLDQEKQQAEIGRIEAETQKKIAETEKIRAEMQNLADKPKLEFKDRQSLNNNVTTLVKEPIAVKKSADALAKLGETKSPTDQLAAIFTFMKSLDPASVVREGEQQQAARTGGVTDQFIGFVNRIRGEGALPPDVFNNMILTAKRVANGALEGSRDELAGFLEPLSDDISAKTRDRLLARVPENFDIPEVPETPPQPVTPVEPPAPVQPKKIGRFEIIE